MSTRKLRGALPALIIVAAMGIASAQAGLHTQHQVEEARGKIAASEEPWASAYTALMEQANQNLGKASEAVADFNVPGFYQDPDGHRNALRTLAQDAWVAYSCAMAYRLTPDGDGLPYADKALEVLDAWATTNQKASGYDGSLVMAYAGVGLLFAAELMTDYDAWSVAQRELFNQWTRTVFLPVCRGIVDRENNWGDWALLGSITAHAYLGELDAVDADIAHLRRKIEGAIHPDGSMPHETRRGKRGIWYTYFALAPLTAACQVAANARSVDLFNYKGANGVGVKDALDYLFHYCEHPEEWPHHTEDDLAHPRKNHWPGNLFEAMSGVYGERRYGDWVNDARPVFIFGHHYAWAAPTLLRTAPPPEKQGDKGRSGQ